MTAQKTVFLRGEGDAWYARNSGVSWTPERKAADDPVLHGLRKLKLRPTAVLEIGASNGWRLHVLAREFGATVSGIDPSRAAVEAGKALYPEIELRIGTADRLPFDESQFDTVILGFCLYLCDRSDLFAIAGGVDRVLRDGGVMVIHDFLADPPYRNPYRHCDGVYSYKMDYSRMFTWNPAYRLIGRTGIGNAAPENLDQVEDVAFIRKDIAAAYAEGPPGCKNS